MEILSDFRQPLQAHTSALQTRHGKTVEATYSAYKYLKVVNLANFIMLRARHESALDVGRGAILCLAPLNSRTSDIPRPVATLGRRGYGSWWGSQGAVSPTWGETGFPACHPAPGLLSLMTLAAFREGSTLLWAGVTRSSLFAFIYFHLHLSEGDAVV